MLLWARLVRTSEGAARPRAWLMLVVSLCRAQDMNSLWHCSTQKKTTSSGCVGRRKHAPVQIRMPSHMVGAKGDVLEGGVRALMLMSGPGVPTTAAAPPVVQKTVLTVNDLLPTIVDLAGLRKVSAVCLHLPVLLCRAAACPYRACCLRSVACSNGISASRVPVF